MDTRYFKPLIRNGEWQIAYDLKGTLKWFLWCSPADQSCGQQHFSWSLSHKGTRIYELSCCVITVCGAPAHFGVHTYLRALPPAHMRGFDSIPKCSLWASIPALNKESIRGARLQLPLLPVVFQQNFPPTFKSNHVKLFSLYFKQLLNIYIWSGRKVFSLYQFLNLTWPHNFFVVFSINIFTKYLMMLFGHWIFSPPLMSFLISCIDKSRFFACFGCISIPSSIGQSSQMVQKRKNKENKKNKIVLMLEKTFALFTLNKRQTGRSL